MPPDQAGYILEPGDDLDRHLEEALADPVFRAAWDDAQARDQLRTALATERKTLGLSCREVARRMHVSHLTVITLEAGTADPRLSVLQAYARAIGARLDVTTEESPAAR